MREPIIKLGISRPDQREGHKIRLSSARSAYAWTASPYSPVSPIDCINCSALVVSAIPGLSR